MRRLPWEKLMSFRVSSFIAPRSSSNNGATNALDSGASSGPFRLEQVRIRLTPEANRHVHPRTAIESAIDTVWREYKERSPRLFNATKFRLQSYQEIASGGDGHASPSNAQTKLLTLEWGITDYKTYLGTCCSTNVTQLLADGKKLTANGDEFAFVSRKVGVAAVVETSDGKIALIKRSNSVGVYQDMFDTPGGHPEPSHIGLTADVLEALQCDGKRAERGAMESAAVQEFFTSIVNEVHEEINLSDDQIRPPLLLGVVLQADAATPSFNSHFVFLSLCVAFHIKAKCSSEELLALYLAGPKDKFESSKLVLIDAEAVLMENDLSFLDRLTPSAHGSLLLWKEYAAASLAN
ncbi:hypothetical protein FI667_g7604, partial [Globisporangium splendens]